MTGPEHYRSSQDWLYKAKHDGARGDRETAESCAAIAQVHATLALAAAQAILPQLAANSGFSDFEAWHEAAGAGPKASKA